MSVFFNLKDPFTDLVQLAAVSRRCRRSRWLVDKVLSVGMGKGTWGGTWRLPNIANNWRFRPLRLNSSPFASYFIFIFYWKGVRIRRSKTGSVSPCSNSEIRALIRTRFSGREVDIHLDRTEWDFYKYWQGLLGFWSMQWMFDPIRWVNNTGRLCLRSAGFPANTKHI